MPEVWALQRLVLWEHSASWSTKKQTGEKQFLGVLKIFGTDSILYTTVCTEVIKSEFLSVNMVHSSNTMEFQNVCEKCASWKKMVWIVNIFAVITTESQEVL